MAANAISDEVVLSREQLRTFHLSGQGLDDLIPPGPLRPTTLAGLGELPDLESAYPLCLHPGGGVQPLRELLNGLAHAPIITSAFRMAMNGRTFVSLDEVAPAAIDSLVECSPSELARLRKLLPPGTFLVAFHADSLVLLHAAALAESRRESRLRFWEDVQHLAARLREILLLDDSHVAGAISPESVTASLGSRVGAFFNPVLLAKSLQTPRNPLRRMDPERRSRCETTLAMLEEGLEDAEHQPAFWLYHSGICGATTPPAGVGPFHGEARWAIDTFAAAMHFCDGRLDRLTQLLRALRVARLEIDSTFDPLVHEEMLARFDWQAASPAELLALPPVVVIETADSLSQASLTSFGRLLRSGRPVQILILRSGLEPSDLSEFTPDFAYLSIAHRESFVLQSSLAQLAHLLPGLKSMANTLRPAVAVVATPRRVEFSSGDEAELWLEECLLVLSRTVSLYSYNPEAGMHWADRFRLLPQAESSEALSPAHAAAVSHHLRQQFRLMPPAAWTSEQMELNPYLDAYTSRPPLAIPYIWVEGPNGGQQRALLTRNLVNFCLDRRRAWALFEELSQLGKPQLQPDENARQEGAREAIQKVLALLAPSA